jgi:hypothetical protein
MAFHRNNNGQNGGRHHRQNFRPRHNNNHQPQQNGQRRHVNRVNHVFESTGPDGRVRGTAQQLVEKYAGLARDAHASGDSVLSLNCYQHAEHYQRLYNEILEENGHFEREREAQRAAYQSQPNFDNDGNGQQQQNDQGDMQQDQRSGMNDQPQSGHYGQQQQHSAPQQQAAPQQQRHSPPPQQQQQMQDDRDNNGFDAPQPQQAAATPPQRSAAASSTGGRVLGRRPAAPRGDQPTGAGQLRDDDMPSFLKKDIPIKTAAPAAESAPKKAPAAPAAAADAVPAAFGRVRRAPAARRPAATTDAEPEV